MEYVFYIDVFVLRNCVLNMISLALTSVILRKPIHILRIVFASMSGSVWNCALVLLPMELGLMELPITVFGIGGIMAAIVCGGSWQFGRRSGNKDMEKKQTKCNPGSNQRSNQRSNPGSNQGNNSETQQEPIKDVHRGNQPNSTLSCQDPKDLQCTKLRMLHGLKKIFIFDVALLVSSSLVSGCMMFAAEHFFLTGTESLLFTGALAGVVGVFLKEYIFTKTTGDERYQVRLYYRQKIREFTALADSGNRLRVPETGKVVSVISYQDCHDFCDRVSGGFFIPYRAVGTDCGLLFAITFDKMEIEKNGMCVTIEYPAVAITREQLAAGGDFNMLLPEEYVNRIM